MSFWKKLFGREEPPKADIVKEGALNPDIISNPRSPRTEEVELSMSADGLAAALIKAAINGNVATAQALLIKGADINAKDSFKDITVLMWASSNGDCELVQALLERGANVNAKDADGYTALMKASLNIRPKVVHALLSNGADVNAIVSGGKTTGGTALTMSVGLGPRELTHELVLTLIEKGADVNARRNDDVTALMLASGLGYRVLVQALIEKEADVNAKDKYGDTALDYATKGEHAEASDLAEVRVVLETAKLNQVRSVVSEKLLLNAEGGQLIKSGATNDRQQQEATTKSPEQLTRGYVLREVKKSMDGQQNKEQQASICLTLVGLGLDCRTCLLEIVLDKSLDFVTRRHALRIASGFRDEVLFEFIRSNCLAGKTKGELSRALGDDQESHSKMALYITGEEILNTPDFFERYVAKFNK